MTNNLPTNIKKYLSKFSLDKWTLESEDKKYDIIIVIPVLEEYSGVQRLLKSFLKNDHKYFDKTLFVFVINNVDVIPKEAKEDNQNSLKYLRAILSKSNHNLENGNRINIGIVDASSESLVLPPKDGGVGLARKIGMDLALTRFDYEANQNLLVCLDGDCEVESNYLQILHQTSQKKNVQAGYVKYEHTMPEEDDLKQAIICYEIFLRYYVLGLTFANSPYAIHTIGSTMFCTPESYVKIQGMNKRKAAEDFYFMEKLSKISPITVIDETRVYPSNRPSWRVPFGTGQRVRRHLNGEQNEYLLYSFNSFLILKEWTALFSSSDNLDPDFLLNQANLISPFLHSFLENQKFKENWSKILSDSTNIEQINKQKRFWFDGFRTLKLIHHLRDEQYPLEPMFDVLDQAFEKLGLNTIDRDKNQIIPSTDVQFEYLSVLRQHY